MIQMTFHQNLAFHQNPPPKPLLSHQNRWWESNGFGLVRIAFGLVRIAPTFLPLDLFGLPMIFISDRDRRRVLYVSTRRQ